MSGVTASDAVSAVAICAVAGADAEAGGSATVLVGGSGLVAET